MDIIKSFTPEKQGYVPEIILVSPTEIGEDIKKSPFYGAFYENAIEHSREFPDCYRKVANEKGCVFFNAAEYLSPSPIDSLHFSPEGHKTLAEELFRVKENIEKNTDSDSATEEDGNVVVPLEIIIDAIESVNDEWNQYLDIENMEVVMLPEYPFAGEYDEDEKELAEQIEEEWNIRFYGLPSKYDVHEYSIMERFIWSLPEGNIQDRLESAIRGRGAFRRFKDNLIRMGIEQQWYDYQGQAYRKFAIEWCDDHGFKYVEKKRN